MDDKERRKEAWGGIWFTVVLLLMTLEAMREGWHDGYWVAVALAVILVWGLVWIYIDTVYRQMVYRRRDRNRREASKESARLEPGEDGGSAGRHRDDDLPMGDR